MTLKRVCPQIYYFYLDLEPKNRKKLFIKHVETRIFSYVDNISAKMWK